MKLGAMINDLARSAIHKPVTEKYPYVRSTDPARLRGKLIWDPAACIGCGLCVKDCPSGALELIVIDKQAKLFELIYREDRCLYCGQCVHSCRQECLVLSNTDWELATLNTDDFQQHYQGRQNDVEDVAATRTSVD
jgi:ech hydrogenase subunit F